MPVPRHKVAAEEDEVRFEAVGLRDDFVVESTPYESGYVSVSQKGDPVTFERLRKIVDENFMARDLEVGLPEAQSTALGGLGGGGIAVLPIISEFLDSTDPLVRESAVDAAFTAGGGEAVPLVVERIEKEKAESVLHAMLRGLGKHQTAALIAEFAGKSGSESAEKAGGIMARMDAQARRRRLIRRGPEETSKL